MYYAARKLSSEGLVLFKEDALIISAFIFIV
jgi:hypothetical protein